MTRTFHDVDQNSDDWLALRCGLPTASAMAQILATGRGNTESVTRRKYMAQLSTLSR